MVQKHWTPPPTVNHFCILVTPRVKQNLGDVSGYMHALNQNRSSNLEYRFTDFKPQIGLSS